MCRATSYPLLTGGVQTCALLIRSWPEARRCWNFYSIFTDVFPLSKKHIHPFNPKTKFLQTVLNQTSEKKKKWNSDSRKEISKTERFFNKPCKRSLSTWNKNTIYYLYHMPYIAKIGSKYSHVILLAYWHS